MVSARQAALLPFALGLALGALTAPPARADVGPPDRSCTAERRCVEGGVECHYLNSDPRPEDVACEEDAERRGLVMVCQRGGGTVGHTIYCPKDRVRKGCSIDHEAGGGGLVTLVAGLLALRLGRHRRRSSSAAPRRR